MIARDTNIPIHFKSETRLVEDLCLFLRDVGVFDHRLPTDTQAIIYIEQVKLHHHEITKRGIDIALRIQALTDETGWLMEVLLSDCLNYPETVPYVREKKSGIRRVFGCYLCYIREAPDREGIWVCDDCLERLEQQLQMRVGDDVTIILRSYSKELWCDHADSETPLAFIYEVSSAGAGYCEKCILKEKQRRSVLQKKTYGESTSISQQ